MEKKIFHTKLHFQSQNIKKIQKHCLDIYQYL